MTVCSVWLRLNVGIKLLTVSVSCVSFTGRDSHGNLWRVASFANGDKTVNSVTFGASVSQDTTASATCSVRHVLQGLD